MGKIGVMELVLILGIALIVFGPGKLPEVGKAMGRAISEFKHHATKAVSDDKGSSKKNSDTNKEEEKKEDGNKEEA